MPALICLLIFQVSPCRGRIIFAMAFHFNLSFMYENKYQPIASKRIFFGRLKTMALLAAGMLSICLLIGILGYHYIAHISWIDSIHNASMILSGMGPVANIDNVAGKLFSSAYALFSGVAFITNIGIFLAPVVHRFLHKIHLEEGRQST